MKKTLFAATLMVAIAATTTASHAFSWSNLNPATWGNSSCPKCEKVCHKDNCGCSKCKCKKEKCDPCKKNECNPCKQKCNPCDKKAETCSPCKTRTMSPCESNKCKPMSECSPCDKLQEVAQ